MLGGERLPLSLGKELKLLPELALRGNRRIGMKERPGQSNENHGSEERTEGEPWQRIPYVVRVEADARLDLVRWSRLGLGLETINVFYYGDAHEVQSSHAVNFDVYLYGNSLAILLYAGWWPYDNQIFRNRDGKVVGGLEISF